MARLIHHKRMEQYASPRAGLPTLVNLPPKWVDLSQTSVDVTKMKTYARVGVKTAVSMYDGAEALDSFTYCRVLDQRIDEYVDRGPKRKSDYRRVLKSLAEYCPLPNFEFFIAPPSTATRMTVPPRVPESAPVFLPGGARTSSPFFTIPSTDEVNRILYAPGRRGIVEDPAWDSRRREVFDAAHPHSRPYRMFKFVFLRADQVSGVELLEWFQSGTTVLLEGELNRWQESLFSPWRDYVPFGDLGQYGVTRRSDALAWCLSNEEKCKGIASTSASRDVTHADLFDYLQALMVLLDESGKRDYYYPSLSSAQWMARMLEGWYDETRHPSEFLDVRPADVRFPDPHRRTAGFLRACSYVVRRLPFEGRGLALEAGRERVGNLHMTLLRRATLHEAFMGLEVANAMMTHTPNFAYSYAYLPTGTLLQEGTLDGLPTLAQWIRDSPRAGRDASSELGKILFQIAMSLELAQKKFAFVHGSLTADTIYVLDLATPKSIDYHPKLFETYVLRHARYLPILSHFSRSRGVVRHTHFTPFGAPREDDFGEDMASLLRHLTVYFPGLMRAARLMEPFGPGRGLGRLDWTEETSVVPGDFVRFLLGLGVKVDAFPQNFEAVRSEFTSGDNYVQVVYETLSSSSSPEEKGLGIDTLFRSLATSTLPSPSGDPLLQNVYHAEVTQHVGSLYRYWKSLGSPENAGRSAESVSRMTAALYPVSTRPMQDSPAFRSIPTAIQLLSSLTAVPGMTVSSPPLAVLEQVGRAYRSLMRYSDVFSSLVFACVAPPTLHLVFADVVTYLQYLRDVTVANLENPLLADWHEQFEETLQEVDRIYT